MTDLRRLALVNPSVLSKLLKSAEVGGPRLMPPVVLRLDGVGFGRALTSAGFKQPRDERVHEALVKAAEALMRRFSGVAAYVVSDEISVLLGSSIPYGGRLFKIVSVAASVASASITAMLGIELLMDCRPVLLPSMNAWGAYVLWRSRVAANNYVSKLYHSTKRGSLTPSFLSMLYTLEHALLERDAWEILGSCLTYASEEVEKVNPLTGEPVKKRRRVIRRFDGPWRCLR